MSVLVLHDHLSVTAIINTTGAVQERYGYDGFGPRRVLDASFGARASSLYDWETGFGAYRLDTETGMYQVRHRYYHPKMGRWIARDLIEVPDETNSYAYARNAPQTMSDSFGLTTFRDWCERMYPGNGHVEIGDKCYNRRCIISACQRQFECLFGHSKWGGIVAAACAVCCLGFLPAGPPAWWLCFTACATADGLITFTTIRPLPPQHQLVRRI
ncbi:MAG: RHS repeat-associated core domain-containing protein [Verrucomicrobiales bacterium]|nr:RHS repeat-associated core domain-containing protein [Verrucomicrobiales bacterium]